MIYEKLYKRAGEELKLLTTVEEIRAFLEIDESVTGITAAMIANWNTAFSWGNHASAGYLTALPAHTHPLSDLQQSGATSNQVPQWNGSAWVPATISVADTHIGNTNLTLTANRTLELDTYTFSFKKSTNTYFHLFNNGRVWIGAGTPSDAGFMLDVTGSVRIGGTLTFTGSVNLTSTASICRIGTQFANSIIFVTNNADRWYILSSGHLQCAGVFLNNYDIGGTGNGEKPRTIYAWQNIVIGQVSSPSTKAALQIDSTTRGFLSPRMTTTQKNAITTPDAGLQLYDTTLNSPDVYNGTAWHHQVIAPNSTKVTAGAPYTNDGYVEVKIGGVTFKLMTTA